MNWKFWQRDRYEEREQSRPRSSEVAGGGFGAATGRTGSVGNMGGGGSDKPLRDAVNDTGSTGRIGDSDRGRH